MKSIQNIVTEFFTIIEMIWCKKNLTFRVKLLRRDYIISSVILKKGLSLAICCFLRTNINKRDSFGLQNTKYIYVYIKSSALICPSKVAKISSKDILCPKWIITLFELDILFFRNTHSHSLHQPFHSIIQTIIYCQSVFLNKSQPLRAIGSQPSLAGWFWDSEHSQTTLDEN